MGSVGDCNSVCVAESLDGIVWHKPNLTTGPRPGTNVVFDDPPVDTATVWRDERADSKERYKLAIVPTNGTVSELAAAHGYYQLYSSADGITWNLRVNRTGPTEDGDTIFYNPYRDKWVWSIKGLSYYSKSLGGITQGPWDRHRLYRETNDLFGPDSQWRPEELVPWYIAFHADHSPTSPPHLVLFHGIFVF